MSKLRELIELTRPIGSVVDLSDGLTIASPSDYDTLTANISELGLTFKLGSCNHADQVTVSLSDLGKIIEKLRGLTRKEDGVT